MHHSLQKHNLLYEFLQIISTLATQFKLGVEAGIKKLSSSEHKGFGASIVIILKRSFKL